MSNQRFKSFVKNHATAAKWLCLGCVLLLLLITGSCASIYKIFNYKEIMEYKEDPRFYSIRRDLALFRSSFIYDFWNGRGDKYDYPFLLFLLPLIDLPFSLVTDIIMHPYDKYYYTQMINE